MIVGIWQHLLSLSWPLPSPHSTSVSIAAGNKNSGWAEFYIC
jgi:hypothetical protein